ncbi:MAG: UvrD-helicase domain-containing protein [Bernardetiaceae bacterium]
MNQQKFNIYRSSAGSGKTFTLTKEYLKLVLFPPVFSPDYYRHILAITFTRDAAREMKVRILDALLDFQKENPDNQILIQKILEETPTQDTDTQRRALLKERAALIHKTILHNYSDFAVSTIDAFNQRIVRAFGKDLDLPYNFAIEQDTDELVDTAVGQLFQRIGPKGDPELSHIVQEFARFQRKEEKDWNIDRHISNFAGYLLDESKQELLAQVQALTDTQLLDAQKQLKELVAKTHQRIREIANKALIAIHQAGCTSDMFYYKDKGIYGYFTQHSQPEAKHILEDSQEKTYIRATVVDGNWGKKSKQIPDTLKANLLQAFQEIEGIKAAIRDDYWAATHMKRDVFQLLTLKWLHEVVERIKREKGQVFFSDFNKNINRIVEKEPVPYLYERIGERFYHILIDEFQDTSQLQWHNLIPLVANGLGFGMMNMIVGDAKQAIYRWRGGKSELIVHLPDVPTATPGTPIAEHIDTFKLQAHPQVLGTNFRSRQHIIQFNNQFFGGLRDVLSETFPDVKHYYQEIEQQTNKKTGGHVEVRFLSSPKETFENDTFQEIQGLVNDLQAKGYRLNDIAILVRANRHAASLGEAFIETGTPILSNESLLLDSSPSVRFVIHFMQLIQRPHSPVTKFEIVRFLEEHLQTEAALSPFVVAERCNQASIKAFVGFLYEHFGVKLQLFSLQYLTLYEIGEELIRSFRLYQNPDEQIYLQKLLDVLLQFSKNNSDNVLDFLAYWERKKSKLAVRSPEGGEAIRIMTIHRSKGLEFPVVILAYADWSLKARGDQKLWVSWQSERIPHLPLAILPCSKDTAATGFAPYYHAEQQATFLDGLNMLYVATTRPTHKLYILSKTPQKDRKTGKPKIPQSLDQIKNTADLLAFFLTRIYPEQPTELKDVYALYEDFDEKEAAKETDNQGFAVQEMQAFFGGESRHKIQMRRNNLRYADSNLSIEDFYAAQKDQRIVPFALERVRYADDIPGVVQRMVSEGFIAHQDQEQLREQLQRIVAMPALQAFFRPNPEINMEIGREIMTGEVTPLRPDRLVRKKDGTLIVMQFHHGPSYLHQQKSYLRKCAKALDKMGQSALRLWLIDTESASLEIIN